MVYSKINWKEISNELLAEWVISEHFKRFAHASAAEITKAYVGVYSTRPTSWLAVMARNGNITRSRAISMEESSDMVRIPGMRRSKFLLPQSLASVVFGSTRLSLADHEWRLRDVKLTLNDYRRILPTLTGFAANSPAHLKDIQNVLGLSGPQARACINVATYDGALIRTPSSNPWSNRWLYVAAPNGLLPSEDDASTNREQMELNIAGRYIENYGPVSVEDFSWWFAVSKKKARALMERTASYEIEPGIWMSKNKKDTFEQFVSNEARQSDSNVRFLPAWDPLLMGYAPGSRQRDCLGFKEIGGYDAAGNGRPVVLIGSRAVAVWNVVKNNSKRLILLSNSFVQDVERKAVEEALEVWANRIGAVYGCE